MKTVFLSAVCLFTALSTTGQTSVITRQSGGQSYFYYVPAQTLDYVVQNCQPGDTIHLPGGIIPYAGITIDKELTIVGAGYDQNGVPVTQKTIVPSVSNVSFEIAANASGSSFHGIDFEEDIEFLTAVSDVSFTRCEIQNVALDLPNLVPANGINFHQCVFRQAPSLGEATNVNITNSVITSYVGVTGNASNILVKQCLFLNAVFTLGQPSGITYQNNLFTNSNGTVNINGSANFTSNLFAIGSPGTVNYGTGSYSLNQVVYPASTQFVGGAPGTSYDYNFDYHAVAGSTAATMQGVGGYQVGIYGGAPGSTWKEDGLPYNPHWESLVTPPITINGILPGVQIQGSAQTN